MTIESKDWLDFVIIGAQKSGTTTLFHHLQEHPDIYMPPEKETAYFSNDEYYQRGWSWFLQGMFGDAPHDKLWGEASPQYMSYPKVSLRIYKQLPNVKCISILRDPVERAYSHYRMGVRRGYEPRSFEECIQAQLTRQSLEASRLDPTRTNSYVIWGEYGRILGEYEQHFPRQQILVLFTEDLASDPKTVLMQVYDFLGLTAILPRTLGQRFHQGGSTLRFPLAAKIMGALPVQAMRRVVPTALWHRLGPLRFAFEQWNTIPEQPAEVPLEPQTRRQLQAHYQADALALEQIVQRSVSWLPYSDSGAI